MNLCYLNHSSIAHDEVHLHSHAAKSDLYALRWDNNEATIILRVVIDDNIDPQDALLSSWIDDVVRNNVKEVDLCDDKLGSAVDQENDATKHDARAQLIAITDDAVNASRYGDDIHIHIKFIQAISRVDWRDDLRLEQDQGIWPPSINIDIVQKMLPSLLNNYCIYCKSYLAVNVLDHLMVGNKLLIMLHA
jgi:hypothetical protein